MTQARSAVRNFFSCLFFFICAGMAYGQFTARIPALKAHAGISDAQLGLVLLVFGVGSIAGFVSAPPLLRALPSRGLLMGAAVALLAALTGMALAPGFAVICGVAAVFGVATAVFDVCMNVQAMLLERASLRSRMATLHACYSIGGFLGSMIGSAFAYAHIGVFANFLCVFLFLTPLVIVSGRHLLPDIPGGGTKRQKHGLPLFIFFCGLMARNPAPRPCASAPYRRRWQLPGSRRTGCASVSGISPSCSPGACSPLPGWGSSCCRPCPGSASAALPSRVSVFRPSCRLP